MQIFDTESKTKDKIREFSKLPIGWHFGEGAPPSRETQRLALKMTDRVALYGLRTDAFPGIAGEIMVTGYRNQTYLEFTFEPDGSVTFVMEEGDEEIEYEENLTFDEVKKRLDNAIGDEKWKNLYELLAQNIMTHANSSLRASLSGIQLVPAFQSFSSPVYVRTAGAFADISKNITEGLRQAPLSFGHSGERSYQIDALLSSMTVIPEMCVTET